MLARSLPGVPVLVARERFLAGRVAERRFGATVHLLDDGFQHLPLARDVELLIVSRRPISTSRSCRPGACASRSPPRGADAVLVPGSEEDAREVAARPGSGRSSV